MPEAYPLHWPAGWPRATSRQAAKFGTRAGGATHSRAISFLEDELRRLGARSIVISTNLELRLDGLPRGGQSQPADPGAAVYFTLKGQQRCMPCDRWHRVADNLYAIAKSIEALRGIERWGAGRMVEAAFAGFKALPATGTGRPWWDVLGVPAHATRTQVDEAYRRLALERHPDRTGGDSGPFIELGEARRQAHSSTAGGLA